MIVQVMWSWRLSTTTSRLMARRSRHGPRSRAPEIGTQAVATAKDREPQPRVQLPLGEALQRDAVKYERSRGAALHGRSDRQPAKLSPRFANYSPSFDSHPKILTCSDQIATIRQRFTNIFTHDRGAKAYSPCFVQNVDGIKGVSTIGAVSIFSRPSSDAFAPGFERRCVE
jgi:hypothetical protein